MDLVSDCSENKAIKTLWDIVLAIDLIASLVPIKLFPGILFNPKLKLVLFDFVSLQIGNTWILNIDSTLGIFFDGIVVD